MDGDKAKENLEEFKKKIRLASSCSFRCMG